MQSDYSDKHCAAYKRWQQVGSIALSLDDLLAIEAEDPAAGAHIRQERVKAREKAEANARRELQAARAATQKSARDPEASFSCTPGELSAVFDLVKTAAVNDDIKPWITYLLRHQHDPARVAVVLQSVFAFVLQINAKNKKRSEQIEAMEKRIEELEARPRGVIDRGVYKAGETYEEGEGVTFDGSFWIAQRYTSAQPASGPPDRTGWRLAVKKGRDAK